ncbi:hypothetical protein VE03_01264 [Pseudogymnoascus sp. 23342-1-I1]|nr:hypothetical protein VE03_01264 [Pseudogymnoascus sp. 23342-1-I1]
MGFHGYGGSELDHSDCLISPCSVCRQQLEQQQPSARSGNTFSSPFNNSNDQESRANVFGHENINSSDDTRAARAGSIADNMGGLSGGLENLSISDQDRTMDDEMSQSDSDIPPTSEVPALRRQARNQNLREGAGFQTQDQAQPGGDGTFQLSDEDRALRDEMRRTGFRIPSVSDDPALSRADGTQNHSNTTGFQAQGQYQAANNAPGPATASFLPGTFAPASRFGCLCVGCRSGEVPCSYAPPESSERVTDGLAPWAYEHPTNEETLRRVLRNKFLAANGRSVSSPGNPQPSAQPGTSSQGQTGRRAEVPIVRLTRLDGSEMELDEAYDWESANEH